MSLIGSIGDIAPSIHPEAWIAPGAVVVGRVAVDRAASVWYGSVLRADDEEIVVGAECNVQDLCCLHVDPGEPVILEEDEDRNLFANTAARYVSRAARHRDAVWRELAG